MLQIVEQTKEQKMSMYMKLPKKEIAEMLIKSDEINIALIQQQNKQNSFFEGVKPIGGKILDSLEKCISENGKSKPTLKNRL